MLSSQTRVEGLSANKAGLFAAVIEVNFEIDVCISSFEISKVWRPHPFEILYHL